jgi:hypothetical protein
MIELGLSVAGLYVSLAGVAAHHAFWSAIGEAISLGILSSLRRIAMSANYAAHAEIATLKAKGLEGRHRNFQRLVRI